ncbi:MULTISPECIES: SGNH/GDSL hydrolase family protein [Caproicibacterium]|uniref:SGNH/GDSL hydrolase family protein n=1 Tax=Caproicibacterium argilliputei TaxID=3030016 RepID=A0AA97DC26_9FIRM|nr:SGNH/GDSL hydrolase family protein [Caproicibacterium argilliputei]WOC33007.1 SGNH/GDSL hydrolase family protein [Caproicibacterium argilliputei]
MNGPVAPKDPEKKRPYFYIMRDKEVFGAKQESGKGVQFIYEDNGRLINSAQIAGNITDEATLDLLKTTAGFRKLVHSIGVSAQTENPNEALEFVFQMYGKTDVYGSGTNIRAKLTGNGMETRIHLNEIAWSAEDNVPGQIRFEFDTPELLANVSVRFYLNDGFTAPEPIEDQAIDFASGDYKKMIARSLLQLGNTARLKKAAAKAQRGEDVTIAFIGGSITQGAGATPINTESYAYQFYRRFAETYGTGSNVHLIKAGVGGTPSELGMIRFERDVLRDGSVKPDLVVIEFAVNDEGDETKGICYESLVRKALKLPEQPAVILLFCVFAHDWNLQERLSPVGKLYHLPMVSILDAVSPQFPLKPGEGRVLSKNQFFYDVFHPSNTGHLIMADCLAYLVKQAVAQKKTEADQTEALLQQKPVLGGTYEDVRLLDRKDNFIGAKIDCGSFAEHDDDLQCVEQDDHLETTPEFPYNWCHTGTETNNDAFRLQLTCKALLLVYKDSGETNAGQADVFVDGKKVMTVNPRTIGWTHCNPLILFHEETAKAHTVELRMVETDRSKKFTILGFGYVK